MTAAKHKGRKNQAPTKQNQAPTPAAPEPVVEEAVTPAPVEAPEPVAEPVITEAAPAPTPEASPKEGTVEVLASGNTRINR